MASISALSFRFVRQKGPVSTFHCGLKELQLNTGSMTAWSVGWGPVGPLPRKMTMALVQAAMRYNAENPHIRKKWRPRLG